MIVHKNQKILEPGDKIKVGKITAEIKTIMFQEYYPATEHDPECFILEFRDTNDVYRSYKSQYDNGEIIPKENSDFFDVLKQNYSPEDFSGHFGVLLDDHADPEDISAAMQFVHQIYQHAVQHLS